MRMKAEVSFEFEADDHRHAARVEKNLQAWADRVVESGVVDLGLRVIHVRTAEA